jgi:hypothetical protein
MADDLQDNGIEAEGAPGRDARTGGGCMLVSAILLLLIIAALVALAWQRSRNGAPDPASTGHPTGQRGQ